VLSRTWAHRTAPVPDTPSKGRVPEAGVTTIKVSRFQDVEKTGSTATVKAQVSTGSQNEESEPRWFVGHRRARHCA
jgi:hypothetical protein